MTPPRVSILTPTYNHAATLAQTIESVLAQTWNDWELLIMNDGSPDHSAEILAHYARLDPRIRVYSQARRGMSALAGTYRRLLAEARGDLIALLDSDDLWPTHKLATQVALHADPAVLMSHGRTLMFSEDLSSGRVNLLGEYPRPALGGTQSTETYLRLALLRRSCLLPVSVMIRADALRTSGFRQANGFPGADYATYVQLLRLPGLVRYVGAVLGYWRQSATQSTQVNQRRFEYERLLAFTLKVHRELPAALRARLDLSPADIVRAHWRRLTRPTLQRELFMALHAGQREPALRAARELARIGGLREQGLSLLVQLALRSPLDPAWLLGTYRRVRRRVAT